MKVYLTKEQLNRLADVLESYLSCGTTCLMQEICTKIIAANTMAQSGRQIEICITEK